MLGEQMQKKRPLRALHRRGDKLASPESLVQWERAPHGQGKSGSGTSLVTAGGVAITQGLCKGPRTLLIGAQGGVLWVESVNGA